MLILSSSSSPPTSLPCFSHGATCFNLRLPPTALHLPLPSTFAIRRSSSLKASATLDEKHADWSTQPSDLLQQPQSNTEVEKSIQVLKTAAKTRKVPANEVLAALSVIEKAKLDPSGFLPTLGGSESPGRTWMLIFTAEKQLKGGKYFPITAVQRFDAAGRRIENGVYLGPIGSLTFEGGFSWNKRILAFIFERIRIKIGPLKPLEVSLGKGDDKYQAPKTHSSFGSMLMKK